MTTATDTTEASVGEEDLAGIYVTFKVNEERFALGISEVREVGYAPKTRRMPHSDPAMRGVMNLRGRVVPVLDLNYRLRGIDTQVGRDTCILVLDAGAEDGAELVGAMADSVQEVIRVSPDDELPAPAGGTSCPLSFVKSIIQQNDEMIMVLNLSRVLPQETDPKTSADGATATSTS